MDSTEEIYILLRNLNQAFDLTIITATQGTAFGAAADRTIVIDNEHSSEG